MSPQYQPHIFSLLRMLERLIRFKGSAMDITTNLRHNRTAAIAMPNVNLPIQYRSGHQGASFVCSVRHPEHDLCRP